MGALSQKRLINIILVIFSLCVAIYGLELALRLTTPAFLKTNYSITGDFTDFVNRGFFDATIFHKDPGVIRILGIGDSFSEFFKGTALNYHNILEKQLNKSNSTKKYEVINAGISNTGPGYYWNTLEKFGDLFKPDLVLIAFFIGNDFTEMRFNSRRIGMFIVEPVEGANGLSTYLNYKRLWIFQLVRGWWIAWRNSLSKGAGTFSEDEFYNIEKTRLWIFENSKREKLDKLWNNDSVILSKINNWCRERKIPFLVVVIPDQIQVDETLQHDLFAKFNISANSVDLLYPNNILINYFERNHIHYVDLTIPMQKAGKSRPLYLVRDTHWNEAGHEIAGNIIGDYVRTHNLLK
ncbi:MAG: alginate O-acetyltransferase AlgX-related protein [Thermodesulfobacteriota bacterium]